MDRDTFAKVQDAVVSALDLEPDARAEFLRELSARDVDVHREVARLLSRADGADAALVPPIEAMMGPVGPLTPDDDDPLIGRTLGAFTIERLIGAGGMGRVYRAQQASPARAVAVKVLASRLMGRAAVRRFRQEAELLGRLEHPGICRVYQAETVLVGVDSVPFIAMELVEGVPLLDAARTEPVGARLELFLKVCDAVAYAHQRAVIHRDLKPANIMVVDAGGAGGAGGAGVKVLDFGIARMVGPPVHGGGEAGGGERGGTRGPRADALTEATALLGTVEYMSPEQLHGRTNEVDTRSDVYALGLVLFEMLAGERAFKSPSSWAAAAERLANEAAPRLRSASRGLAPELDIIVGTALEPDRTRRYQSVAALADDVRRFLDHRPLAARAPTWPYVLSKFVRRNRAVSVSIAAAGLAVVLGVAGASVSWRRAVEARDRATLAAARSRASEYVACVQAASAALRADDVATARERLNAAPSEHRGWEWRFLEGRLDQSDRAFDPPTSPDTGVLRIAPSPDGRLVAVACVRWLGVYERRSGALLRSTPSAGSGTVSIQWTDGGRRILMATGWGKRVVEYDATTLTILRESPEFDREVTAARLSPDGRVLAVAAGMPRSGEPGDRRVQLWDGASWSARGEIAVEVGRADEVSFSPDGARLLTLGSGRAMVWDTASAKSLAWEPGGVQGAAWSPDGRTIITAGEGGVVAWDAATLARRETLGTVEVKVHATAAGGDPPTFAVGDDTRIRAWDLTTGRLVARLRGHPGRVRALAVAAGEGGPDAISGGDGGFLRAWRVGGAPSDPLSFAGHENAVAAADFSIIAHDDPNDPGAVVVRRGDTGEVIKTLTDGSTVRGGSAFAVAPDGSWVARLRLGVVTRWTLPEGLATTKRVSDTEGPLIRAAALGRDALVCTGDARTVRVLDAATLDDRAVFRSDGDVLALGVAAGGACAAATKDRITIWDEQRPGGGGGGGGGPTDDRVRGRHAGGARAVARRLAGRAARP